MWEKRVQVRSRTDRNLLLLYWWLALRTNRKWITDTNTNFP